MRYPGFSFHDDAKAFLRILHDWDQWGMCQVQMNILDDENQATLEGIREAGRRGVGVVVMEPLRGGLLANPPVDVKAVYDAYAVQRSPVEWGFRYLYAMPEVITILSGMSTWEQVTDNLRIFDMAKRPTLTDEELALYQKVKATYLARTKTRCTGCKYCQPCPMGVQIPRIFQGLRRRHAPRGQFLQGWIRPDSGGSCGCVAVHPLPQVRTCMPAASADYPLPGGDSRRVDGRINRHI